LDRQEEAQTERSTSFQHRELIYFVLTLQRQAERIKREKAQARRGDDAEPQNQPESLVAVARFHGSRLASAPTPSPYQDDGTHSQTSDGKRSSVRRHKVARLSSTANIGAAIVEAENSLEIEVCFPA
jgi:5'-3' exoribonuclease 2